MTQVGHTLTALPLSEQLQKLIKNAEVIRSAPIQVFAGDLSNKLLWLRPSVNGVSAISCAKDTPQIGVSKVSSRNLPKVVEQHLSSPKRATPEKQLQSWLIQQALQSCGRLKPLDDLLGGHYWFISDEIALRTASRKLVADLLLVRVDDDGFASLVNAELKSERSMQTFRQVISFRAALDDSTLLRGWKTFADVMTGKSFQWHPSRETQGIVIWPAVGKDKDPKKARANGKRKEYERVDLIGYRFDPATSEYTLEIERLEEEA